MVSAKDGDEWEILAQLNADVQEIMQAHIRPLHDDHRFRKRSHKALTSEPGDACFRCEVVERNANLSDGTGNDHSACGRCSMSSKHIYERLIAYPESDNGAKYFIGFFPG
jgi:hypothetical protein